MAAWWVTDRTLADQLAATTTPAQFLALYLARMKQHKRGLSYARLSTRAGISKSLLVAIVQEKKTLSSRAAEGLSKALDLPAGLDAYWRGLANKATPGELARLRDFFIDGLEQSEDFDRPVSDEDFPLLYAALSDVSGSTVLEIQKKLPWPSERISFLLKELALKKFVTRLSGERWKGTKLFLTTIARSEKSWLPAFYRSALRRHLALTEKDFFSRNHLSLAYSFALKSTDFAAMNERLKARVAETAREFHHEDGDKIVTLVLGTHLPEKDGAPSGAPES